MIDFHAARMLVADAENMRLDEIDENGLEDNEAYMVSYRSPDDPLLRAGNPGVHFFVDKVAETIRHGFPGTPGTLDFDRIWNMTPVEDMNQ